MKNLLSYALIFSLIFNMCSPAFSQVQTKNISPAQAGNLPYDKELGGRVKTILDDLALKQTEAEALKIEAERAYSEGDYQKADQIQRQLENLANETRTSLKAIEQAAEYPTTRLSQAEATAALLEADEHRAPGSGAYKPSNSKTYAVNYNVGLREVITAEMLREQVEDKKIKFEDLIHFIRPLGQGVLYDVDPLVVGSAADILGTLVTSLAQMKNPLYDQAFVANQLFRSSNPNLAYRTDPQYIQKQMLLKLNELAKKPNPSLEEVQAINSLRVSLFRLLKYYFDRNVPNSWYFYDFNISSSSGNETPEERKASQEKLMALMYEGMKKDLVRYGKTEKPASQEGQEELAKMSVTASYAALYLSLYKPDTWEDDIFELFKLIPEEQQEAGLKKYEKSELKEPGGKSPIKLWEDADNKLERDFSAVSLVLLTTALGIYKEKEKSAIPFLKKIVARPNEPNYTGHTFPLPLRISALEEAFDIYRENKKLQAGKQFFVYQAITIYGPLVYAKKGEVYGLKLEGMEKMADGLGRYINEMYDENTFQQSLPKGATLENTLCYINAQDNTNFYALEVKTAKEQLKIAYEAAFFWYFGPIVRGVFGILKRVVLLPVVFIKSGSAIWKVWKGGKAIEGSGVVLKWINNELPTAVKAFQESRAAMLESASYVSIHSMGALANSEKILERANKFIQLAKQETATAFRAEEVELLTWQVKPLQKKIREVAEAIGQLRAVAEINPTVFKEIEKLLTEYNGLVKELEQTVAKINKMIGPEQAAAGATGAAVNAATKENTAAGVGAKTTSSGQNLPVPAGPVEEGTMGMGAGLATDAAAGTDPVVTAFTSNSLIKKAWNALKQSTKAYGKAFKDDMVGMRVIKGFLRRNATELVFQVTKDGKTTFMVIRNNASCRRWAKYAQKAFLRQGTLKGPANWFELNTIPQSWADLSRLLDAAKEAGRAVKASQGIEDGYRLYTYSEARAVQELAKVRAKIARGLAKNGGVDMYVEVEAINPELEQVAVEGGVGVYKAPSFYWNLSMGQVPAGYAIKSMGDDALIYFLPKSVKVTSSLPNGLVNSTAFPTEAVSTTVKELENEFLDTTLDKLIFTISGKPNPGKARILIEKLAQKFIKNNFSSATWLTSNLAAHLAVSPTKIVLNSSRNLFTRIGSGAAAPFRQTTVKQTFIKAAKAKWVPESLSPLIYKINRFLTSEYAGNVYAFELFFGLDHVSLLQTTYTDMMKRFQEEDLNKVLEKYPLLRQATEEEKERNEQNPNKKTLLKDVKQANASKGEGLVLTLPLHAAWRAISDARNFLEISSMEWLDFNLIPDFQEKQFALREKQIFLKSIVAQANLQLKFGLQEKSLDDQFTTLTKQESFKTWKETDPNLEKDLKAIFDEHRQKLKEIEGNQSLDKEKRNQKIKEENKNFIKKRVERLLKAEETSTLSRISGNEQLKKTIRTLYDQYRSAVNEIFKKDFPSAEEQQKALNKERTKLNEKISEQTIAINETNHLNRPRTKELIEAEKARTGKSLLEQDIRKAYDVYKQQIKAIKAKTQAGQKANLKKENMQALVTLKKSTTRAFQAAQVREFKAKDSFQAHAAVDNNFEKAIDAVFEDYFKQLNGIADDASLSEERKEMKIKTLRLQLDRKLLILDVEWEKGLLSQTPYAELYGTVYPELFNDIEKIFNKYKEDLTALDNQSLSPEEATKRMKEIRENLLEQEKNVLVTYAEKYKADPTFWSTLKSKVTREKWEELAALRLLINQITLVQKIPQLESNEKAWELLNQQFEEYKNIQLSFYDDSSIGNIDAAMWMLILEENNFMGELIIALGPKSERGEYMEPEEIKELETLENEMEEASQED